MKRLMLFIKEGKLTKDIGVFFIFFIFFMMMLIVSGVLNLVYGSVEFGSGLLIGGAGILFCVVYLMTKWIVVDREYVSKIDNISKYDKLTGLINSIYYRKSIKETILNKKNNVIILCATIGIDRFKNINQSLGYSFGDEIIVAFSRKIRRIASKKDTVCRINGDEFSVLFVVENNEDIEKKNELLKFLLNDKYILSNNEIVTISTSIGLSVLSEEDSGDDLFKKSQIAMTYSKKNGGSQCNIFKENMESKNIFDLQMENDLRNAIPNNELVVHYQPKYSCKTGEIMGAEALVRWFDPRKKKLIPPMQFIKIAEENGLISDIGKFVLKSACEEIEYWKKQGKDINIAVNVSTKQFKEEDLFSDIKNIIECFDIPHSNIELEITESLVMDNVEYGIKILQDLKKLGVRISIDDFGTGYSSLAYLKLIPANTIKVDRSFVSNMEHDKTDLAIVKTIINLSHNLLCDVVAEGVETKRQFEMLRDNDCDYIQGYYFSKPLPIEDFRKLI